MRHVLELMSGGRCIQGIPFSISVLHMLAHKPVFILMTAAKLEYLGRGEEDCSREMPLKILSTILK